MYLTLHIQQSCPPFLLDPRKRTRFPPLIAALTCPAPTKAASRSSAIILGRSAWEHNWPSAMPFGPAAWISMVRRSESGRFLRAHIIQNRSYAVNLSLASSSRCKQGLCGESLSDFPPGYDIKGRFPTFRLSARGVSIACSATEQMPHQTHQNQILIN